MSQPLLTNTTCDIYRDAHSPPSAPDVAGVACRLEALTVYDTSTNEYVTHLLYVPATTDVRDNYPNFLDGRDGDKVYVPDKNGTLFRVVLVRRHMRGTEQDHKQVVLRRQAVTWPSDNV